MTLTGRTGYRFVTREKSGTFKAQVARKEIAFCKCGFPTAEAAHRYAVGRLHKARLPVDPKPQRYPLEPQQDLWRWYKNFRLSQSFQGVKDPVCIRHKFEAWYAHYIRIRTELNRRPVRVNPDK